MQNLVKQLIDANITPFALNSVVQGWQCISQCYPIPDIQSRVVGWHGVGSSSLAGAAAMRTPEGMSQALLQSKNQAKQDSDDTKCQ